MERNEILEELDKHICGLSFTNVISFLALSEVYYYNESKFIHPNDWLSYDEWIFVIGTWLKNANKAQSNNIETFEDVETKANEIKDLLKQLHSSYISEVSSLYSNGQKSIDELQRDVMSSTSLVQEAIFYAGAGALDLQYTSFIAEKYKNDRDWIIHNKGVDINKFQSFYIILKQILNYKMKEFTTDMIKSNYNTNYGINFPYVVGIEEIVSFDDDYRNIINLLSFDLANPSEIKINGLEDFNPLVKFPLIKLDDSHLFVPNCSIVASSLYELPFFWIIKDEVYYRKYGYDNRGSAAEVLTKQLLERVFPSEIVLKNVEIVQNKNVCAEIDVLVIYENIAIIFQVKSKRLTIKSRKGNKESIAEDFRQAIGKAYEQAKESETKMKESNSILICNNREVDLPNTHNTIKIGITLDYFPAVESIIRRELDATASFTSMSIFDLDMLTRYLTAEQFIDYMSFRVKNRKPVFCSSEAGYLGFYLKNNGFEIIEHALENSNQQSYNYNMVVIGEDLAQEIDKRLIPDLNKEYLSDLLEGSDYHNLS